MPLDRGGDRGGGGTAIGVAIHPSEFDVMPFCVSDGIGSFGYAGVVTWDIRAGGWMFSRGALGSFFRKRIFLQQDYNRIFFVQIPKKS